MEFYYILNYYIKYYELVDTIFLALKQKPLGPFSFPPNLLFAIGVPSATAP